VTSGILLTVVFLFLFTTKFRKQLEFITNGLDKISHGDMNERVKIISKDEIGSLGAAFNNMLDEIEKRDFAEKEYTEFVSLINQNPSLEKVGDATLHKIITTINVDAGAFYLYNEKELTPFSVFGLSSHTREISEESSLYKKAKDSREIVEIHFQENNPVIKTGITELKINYLYLLPLFYNNEIIAIMELAAVNRPQIDVKAYLSRIKDQLAIGLANGKALSELKNLVNELQDLNKAYQMQNLEITDKNEELVELHEKLKSGSEELEIQTSKAVESEKIKSQFLANMTHELRTPQNSILGLTELILKDETTSPKTRERLNVVLRNGKKLLTLIENILEYSKLESGNTEIKKSKISLKELTNEVQSFISPLFLEKEVHLVLDIPENIDYEIVTDIKKVEQIIYNLIGNAAKFTKSGYVKLQIRAEENDIQLIVEDTGPGISENDRTIIFEEFRQADANINRKYSGTGLGLAICKRYVELLDGKIDVISSVGKGSIFNVTLYNVINNEFNSSPKIKNDRQFNHELKSLIISEGTESIKLIYDYLKSHNISVEVRNQSQIEINEIYHLMPEIIILDVLSKSKSGWKLLYDIKNNSSISHLPTVVINMDEEANCGLGLNIYEYCAGPLTQQNIHKIIENIEEQQSIKFRKLMFFMSDDKYNRIEDDLLKDELKFYQDSGNSDAIDYIKRVEPDLIIIDLFDERIEPIKILTNINSDLYTKCIPTVAFINATEDLKIFKYLNNAFFESTLLNQFHPLDVLKIIKDRIELFAHDIFGNDQNNIETSIDSGQLCNRNRKSIPENIKVLIVDDNSDARFTIGEIVESLGYQVKFATNGIECLTKLGEELPDIVLLDIMMPRMDGFQTIKKIRENTQYSNLNVYALTAYAMLSDKGIIEKNGFNGLFTKPINTVQMERKLNEIFGVVN